MTALIEQKGGGFQRIITRDESGFFLHHPRGSVWASRDERPRCIKQIIDTEKCSVSILWSVNGLHSLLDVPKGTTYNTVFVTDAVMPSWLAQMNNARPEMRASSKVHRGLKTRTPAAIGLQPRPRVTSSSLDISKGNCLIAIMRAGRTS
jgi:hypothetical protein